MLTRDGPLAHRRYGCPLVDRLDSKNVMTVPLLIIDVQAGFINDPTRHIPARVEALGGD